jgi:hypothetical protein
MPRKPPAAPRAAAPCMMPAPHLHTIDRYQDMANLNMANLTSMLVFVVRKMVS